MIRRIAELLERVRAQWRAATESMRFRMTIDRKLNLVLYASVLMVAMQAQTSFVAYRDRVEYQRRFAERELAARLLTQYGERTRALSEARYNETKTLLTSIQDQLRELKRTR